MTYALDKQRRLLVRTGSTGPIFEILDGLFVDAKLIRVFENVQGAHTPSEHLVYVTMWKMLGSQAEDGPRSLTA